MEKIFTTNSENNIICNVPLMEIIIKKSIYDKKKMTFETGTHIETFGLFDIITYTDYYRESKVDKKYTLLLPTMLSLNVHNKIKEKVVDPNSSEIDYNYYFQYTKGSVIMDSSLLVKDSNISKNFVDSFIFEAFLPDVVKYHEIVDKVWLICNKLNGVKLKIINLILDIIIASICRDPNNLNNDFRFLINKNPNISMNSRKIMKMKDLGRYASTLMAISSAYYGDGKISAINRARSETYDPRRESPTERKLG